jgi:hypothetical protein
MEKTAPPDESIKNEPKTIVAEIAQRILGIGTLESRNSDSLDFYDLSVSSIERALLAAFEAGKKSNQRINGESE